MYGTLLNPVYGNISFNPTPMGVIILCTPSARKGRIKEIEWTLGPSSETDRGTPGTQVDLMPPEENKPAISPVASQPLFFPMHKACPGFSCCLHSADWSSLTHYQHIDGKWRHRSGWAHREICREEKRSWEQTLSYRDGDTFPGVYRAGLGEEQAALRKTSQGLIILGLNHRDEKFAKRKRERQVSWAKGTISTKACKIQGQHGNMENQQVISG